MEIITLSIDLFLVSVTLAVVLFLFANNNKQLFPFSVMGELTLQEQHLMKISESHQPVQTRNFITYVRLYFKLHDYEKD